MPWVEIGLGLDIVGVLLLFWFAPAKDPDPQWGIAFKIEGDAREQWRVRQVRKAQVARVGLGNHRGWFLVAATAALVEGGQGSNGAVSTGERNILVVVVELPGGMRCGNGKSTGGWARRTGCTTFGGHFIPYLYIPRVAPPKTFRRFPSTNTRRGKTGSSLFGVDEGR